MVTEHEPLFLHAGSRAWVDREDDHALDPVQPLDDVAEPWLLDVGLAVDRRDDVRPRLVRHREARPCDRGEEPARVGHHVAHDVDAPEDALALERATRAVVGAEEEPCQAIRFDPVVLLRHREVTAPEPRLDVRERHGRVRRRARARERRVRVPVDEDEIGRLLGDPRRNRRLHLRRIRRVEVEAVARLGDAELVEEDLRTSRGTSAGRCAGRPRRPRRRAARARGVRP